MNVSDDFYGFNPSFESAKEVFPNERESEKWFTNRRWPSGITCPYCDSSSISHYPSTTACLYRCHTCKKGSAFSAKTKTVMEGTLAGYVLWGRAIYRLQNPAQDIPLSVLQEELGVTQEYARIMKRDILDTLPELRRLFGAFNESWLLERHQGFIFHMAKKYEGTGIDMEDFINEGNMAMMNAARAYDPNRNIKFISFCSFFIRKAFNEIIARESGPISITFNQLSEIRRLKRIVDEFEHEFEYTPNIDYIASQMNTNPQKVQSLIRVSKLYSSLNETIYDDKSKEEVIETIEYEGKGPEEQYLEWSRNEKIRQLVSKLPEREAYIVKRYYGFIDERASFRQIGTEIGLSRERVRTILGEALVKLKKMILGANAPGQES